MQWAISKVSESRSVCCLLHIVYCYIVSFCTKLWYYYHRLLRRSVQGSVLYSTKSVASDSYRNYPDTELVEVEG